MRKVSDNSYRKIGTSGDEVIEARQKRTVLYSKGDFVAHCLEFRCAREYYAKENRYARILDTHASHVMLLEILAEGNWILDVSIGTGNLILLTLLTLPEPTSHLSYSTYTSC